MRMFCVFDGKKWIAAFLIESDANDYADKLGNCTVQVKWIQFS